MVVGVVLVRMARPSRSLLAGLTALVALLVASQASFALTRNLRFIDVAWSRRPGAGSLVEVALFAVGAVVPGPLSHGRAGR